MDCLSKHTISNTRVEVRFLGDLKRLAHEKGLGFPCYIDLNRECSALEVAQLLGMPTEKIEAVFVNGCASPVKDGKIKPGDRVGFVPVGIPGPYRVLLGFKKI